MIYKLFPSADASIYSEYTTTNTGMDEILDLSTNLNSTIVVGNNSPQRAETTRTLLQFSSSSLSDIFSQKIGASSWKAYLRVYLAKASALPTNYTIYGYPLSQSWNQGTGRYSNIPETTDGVSWNYRTSTDLWSLTGSSWITSSVSASQSFSPYSSQDIEMDVTNIVGQWVSGTLPNYGILLKHSSSVEFNTGSIFELKYFSRDTHTIYPPNLEFRYNDHSWTTGSLTGSTSIPQNNQFVISLGNNKGEYQQNTIQRFNINVRDKFPTRVFTTSSIYLNNKLLPSQSYYAIKDLHTEETVVDFDTNYTVINCDATSSYFNLDFSGFEPERWMRVVIKTTVGSQTLIFDEENLTFKVKK